MSNELTIDSAETLNAAQIFDGVSGVEDILARLEREVRAIPTDPTTEKGRKEIKSLAYKVSRSKTALDDLGKKVQAEAKAKVDAVNAGRRVIVARLDALRDEVRKPVDEYDAREAARVAEHRGRIGEIQSLAAEAEAAPIHILRQYLADLELQTGHDFQEFQSQADMEIGRTRTQINAAIVLAEKAERDRVEAARVEAIAAEEERKRVEAERVEREKRIAEEAALKAKQEAEAEHARALALAAKQAEEQKAAIERDRLEAIKREQLAKEEAARAIERAAREKEEAEKRSEERRVAAAEKAERDRLEAIEEERNRVEQEKCKEQEAQAAREANLEHRRKINRAAVEALAAGGVPAEYAEAALRLIISGAVPNVSVRY